MTTRWSVPPRGITEQNRLERVDRALLDAALALGAEPVQYPALIDAASLERAEYPSAFPHLLMNAAVIRDPGRETGCVCSGWSLSPAVCYHVYAQFEHTTISQCRMVTARGRCFRHEETQRAGTRQIEFEMREIVIVGSADWVSATADQIREDVQAVARQFDLHGTWEVAEDPFFLPTAHAKALMQRLRETKREYCVGGTALASVNRHGTFFGERFHMRLPDGTPVHTACVAMGLDRWAARVEEYDHANLDTVVAH